MPPRIEKLSRDFFVDVEMGVRLFSVRVRESLVWVWSKRLLYFVWEPCPFYRELLHAVDRHRLWSDVFAEKGTDSTSIAVSPCGMPIYCKTYLRKGIVFSVGSDPYISSEYEDDCWSGFVNMVVLRNWKYHSMHSGTVIFSMKERKKIVEYHTLAFLWWE